MDILGTCDQVVYRLQHSQNREWKKMGRVVNLRLSGIDDRCVPVN